MRITVGYYIIINVGLFVDFTLMARSLWRIMNHWHTYTVLMGPLVESWSCIPVQFIMGI